MSLVPNRPTAEGIEIGRNLGRYCDEAEVEKRKQFPNHAQRCKTCAFRLGTVPNGCVETVMDALKSVMEQDAFMCHQDMKNGEPTKICAGWSLMMRSDAQVVEAPWPYSMHDYSDEERAEWESRNT